MRILIIIPAYNEQENIINTVSKVVEYRKQCDFQLDYVVINDGSKDNTYNICKQNNIPCVNLIQNLGIGGAVQTGYKLANILDYDIAVQFDGDGQHDINSLKPLIEPIISGAADFTVGSRFIEGKSNFKSTFMRRLGIKWLSFIIKLVTGKKIFDVTSGFRAANKSSISLLAQDYPIDYPEPESLVNLIKYKTIVSEIQVNMFEREGGSSSIHSWKSIYYMIKVTLAIIIAGFQKG